MLNHAEVSLLLEELRPWLGSFVQKVQQSDVDEVTLVLRRPGATGRLRFHLRRGNPCFYLVEEKAQALQRPPAFTMALRKHLGGKKLLGWNQPPQERIARFDFTSRDTKITLVAELIPPGGNLLLLDAEERILARLFNDERNGTVGRPYQPPAPPVGEMPARVRPHDEDGFHAFLDNLMTGDGESEAVREQKRMDARRQAKVDTLRKRLQHDIDKAGDPAEWRRYGELLAANPHVDTRDRHEVSVQTPEGEEVTIPVNPSLDTSANIEAWFKKARKATTARKHVEERLRMLEEGELQPAVPAQAAPKPAFQAPNVSDLPAGHIFRLPGGTTILVGRSAKENDRITFGWARGDDRWLHARGVQGSHVAIRYSMADDEETVRDMAARLALHYRARRGEAAGDVQLTRRKYVSPVKGTPGLVRIAKEENRRVAVSQALLDEIERHRVRRS